MENITVNGKPVEVYIRAQEAVQKRTEIERFMRDEMREMRRIIRRH